MKDLFYREEAEKNTHALDEMKAEYIAAHKDLVLAKRHTVNPQGNRGVRYETKPGEAFQMDWGFVKVLDEGGNEYQVACFALCCHHCGSMFIAFFPYAKQENLFIGLISAFHCMGVPEYILTDNIKSVVDHRDLHGKPVWNREYEAFMQTVGLKTKLCKPRHLYTKGKVERLVRFVKCNFLSNGPSPRRRRVPPWRGRMISRVRVSLPCTGRSCSAS